VRGGSGPRLAHRTDEGRSGRGRHLPANPYDSAEIRGTAELIEDADRTLPAALSHKYLGEDPPPEPDDVVRLIVRVTPERVANFSV